MSIVHIRALRSGHAVLLGSGPPGFWHWTQRIWHVSGTCGESSDIIRHHSKFNAGRMGRDISAAKGRNIDAKHQPVFISSPVLEVVVEVLRIESGVNSTPIIP